VTVERDAVHLELLSPHRHLDLTDLGDDAPPHQDPLGGHPSGADAQLLLVQDDLGCCRVRVD
jgi:hypothetical protein